MRALVFRPAGVSLPHLAPLALAGLTLVALAAAEAPLHDRDHPPPARVVVR